MEPSASAVHVLQQKRVSPATTLDEIKKVCIVVSVRYLFTLHSFYHDLIMILWNYFDKNS